MPPDYFFQQNVCTIYLNRKYIKVYSIMFDLSDNWVPIEQIKHPLSPIMKATFDLKHHHSFWTLKYWRFSLKLTIYRIDAIKLYFQLGVSEFFNADSSTFARLLKIKIDFKCICNFNTKNSNGNITEWKFDFLFFPLWNGIFPISRKRLLQNLFKISRSMLKLRFSQLGCV